MARNRTRKLTAISFYGRLTCAILVATLSGQVFALEETLRIPVAASSFLNSEGVRIVPGFRGNPELILADAQYVYDHWTDVLLHFNADPDAELSALPYTVRSQGMTLSSKVLKLGESSAMFNADPKGLELTPTPGAFFAPGDFRADFSIEFWLYATTMREGEQVLAWDGMTTLAASQQPQQLRVEFRDRKLTWDFTSFFVRLAPGHGVSLEAARFTLRNKRELLPRLWQHHVVRYDARRGLLEYLIDGKIEDSAFTTSTGHEGGEPFRPYVGERSPRKVTIGAGLSGFLDEFRISNKYVPVSSTDKYGLDAGYAIFNPINFREIGVGSKILNINAQARTPGASDVGFYYKMADAPGLALRNDSGWIPFKPGQTITEKNQGQFLYLKVELLPDGSGTVSPGVQDLFVTYKPDPPPPAPGGLVATPQDGAIVLRWNKVPANDIQGYLVYYGTRPGQYFGEGSRLGPSPINAGDITELRIEGLENGRLYYFVVQSYDQSNNPIYGIHLKRAQSREVSARPAR